MEHLFCINLQLFEGGAAQAAADGAGNAQKTAENSPLARDTRNPLAGVKYGKQTESEQAGTEPAEKAEAATLPAAETEDAKTRFDKLIKGEFKAEYEARVKDSVNRRLKSYRSMQESFDKINPVLDMLGQKYGVDAKDTDALIKAIQDDDALYEAEAAELGVETAFVKKMKAAELENRRLKHQMEAFMRQKSVDEFYQRMETESAALKEKYPAFDLESELQNPEFVKLMKVPGMSVDTAFTVIHKDELIPSAMQYTAQKVQENVVNNIMAKGTRPAENGIAGGNAVISKTDPSQLTSKDLAEIRRRVARGEKIAF